VDACQDCAAVYQGLASTLQMLDAPEIPESEFWPIARRTQAAGLWCMGVQTKYGGGGLGTFDMCVLMEEMAQHRMGLYNPGAGVFGRTPPPVIWAGTEEQIQKYAVPTIKNASYTFFAITEPSGGSDSHVSSRVRPARSLVFQSRGPR